MRKDERDTAPRDEKPIGRPLPIEERRPSNKAARTAAEVISGDFLGSSRLRRHYPTILYCTLLVFVYIGHTFNYQRLQRLEIQERMELSRERSRAMVFSSMRMNASRHSRILEEIQRRGLPLVESETPPKEIE